MSIEVLDFFNIKSLPLMINNPEGISPFRSAGIEVLKRACTDVPEKPHFARYLVIKRDEPPPCRPV
jgi:GTP cyclohydrolase II